ncbi:MAG: ComEC/Rec2 family competence protein [Deltaproteobacteria bacterium]
MRNPTRLFQEFSVKYKIVLPLIGFASGILLSEHIGNVWMVIAVLAPLTGLPSLFLPGFRFLLFIPLGLLFSMAPLLSTGSSVTDFSGRRIDVEGTLYRAPESRERGSRLFLKADYVLEKGEFSPVSGKAIIFTSERVEGLAYGDRIRVIGIKLAPFRTYRNPGAFDLKKYYGRQGVYLSGFTEGESRIISFGRDKSYSRVLYYLDRVRQRFGNFVRDNFPSPESEILNAVTIGENGGIPRDLRTEFSRAGVAHVLAISGLHVGAVAIVFFLLIKWILKRSEYFLLRFKVPSLAAALTILPVFLYTAVAGFSTSAVRAFIMISLFLLSIILGRDEKKINTLAAAAFIILVWHPWSIFELSFQLSFAAVFGILLVHIFYPFKFGTLKDDFVSLLKTTCAATFATLPFIVNSFGILPAVSIPANLVFVPFVELLIVPLGLVSFLVFLVSPLLAGPLLSLSIFFVKMLVFGIGKLSLTPYFSLNIPPLDTISWVLFALTGIALLVMGKLARLKLLFPLILFAFVLSLIHPLIIKPGRGDLNAYFLDAGENKSIAFFELPDGEKILIDGGFSKYGSSGYIERTVAGRFLITSGVRRIDYLILTSTGRNHISGAKYLLDTFEVKNFWTNGGKLDGELWEIIHNKKIEWKNLQSLEEQNLPENSTIKILKPGDGFFIEDSSFPQPVALMLNFKNEKFLLGESLNNERVQNELSRIYGGGIKSSVLYIRNIRIDESFLRFLRTVSPRVLVTDRITQRTDFGSPVSVFQTGSDGAVKITTNGSGLGVKTYNGESLVNLQ